MCLKVQVELSRGDKESKCHFFYRGIPHLGSSQCPIDIVRRVLVPTLFTKQDGAKGSIIDGEP